MKAKPLSLLLGGIILAVPTAWLYLNSRFHTATAPYNVLRMEDGVEFRDYPARIVASTPMEDGENPGFMRLFQFIAGENDKSRKIPMTTPVLVGSTSGTRTMSFVMPETFVKGDVPEPKAEAVRLHRIEPGRYAVLRFAGATGEANRDIAVAKLQGWLKEKNIQAEGDPVIAYYDPPWTPSFLRRNEVMIRVPTD